MGASYEEARVIEKGLKPGEKVITEGLQKVKPGVTVKPETAAEKAKEASPSPPGSWLPASPFRLSTFLTSSLDSSTCESDPQTGAKATP